LVKGGVARQGMQVGLQQTLRSLRKRCKKDILSWQAKLSHCENSA